MKPRFHLLLITGGLAAAAIPVLGIEAPPDNAPPPEVEAPADDATLPASAYLGVASGPLPEVLAAHLKLGAGNGVLVRNVVPDGPAAAAGIAEHDVILDIAGEPVGSPEELRERTLALQPGDEVDVQVIHQGEKATRKVKLGSRQAALADMPRDLDRMMLDGMPPDQARRIREAIERHLRLGGPGVGAVAPLPPMAEAMREMQDRMARLLDNDPLEFPEAEGMKLQSDATVRIRDDEGTVELKARDGAKELTVRGPDDQIVWSGPWDTEQDKAAAPEDVRSRVEALNLDQGFKGNGLKFNFQWRPMPGPLPDE